MKLDVFIKDVKLQLWVFILLMVMLLLLGLSSATGIQKEWSTVSDFDGGTKSQPSPTDGNYGVETNTDNLGVANGNLELASMKGDSFTLADSDADTWKWNLAATGSPTLNQRAITGGLLVLNFTRVGSTATVSVFMPVSVSGNFDMRLKFSWLYDNSVAASDSSTVFVQFTNELPVSTTGFCGFSGSATSDGMQYTYNRRGDATVNQLIAATCTNNVATTIGSGTVVSTFPIYARIVRESTSIRWLYSSNGVNWVQDESTTFTTSDVLFLQVGFALGTATTIWFTYSFDDIVFTAGTIATNGYRSSGNWTSPIYAVGSNYTVSQIILSHESLTAEYVIDFIRIYSNGTLVWEYTDDIESGTLSLFNVSETIQWNVTVRIGLKGVGSGTPILTAIGIELSEILSVEPEAMNVLALLLIAIVLQFVLWILSLVYGNAMLSAVTGIIGILLTLGLWNDLTYPLNLVFIVANSMVMAIGIGESV